MKRLLLALLFAVTAAAKPVAVRNVRLFDGTRVIPGTTVVFENGIITSIGASVPEGAEVIDGTGKTLLPGMIDSHTHAFTNALERALRFGVTTELDMFTDVKSAKAWKDEQTRGNAAAKVGPEEDSAEKRARHGGHDEKRSYSRIILIIRVCRGNGTIFTPARRPGPSPE